MLSISKRPRLLAVSRHWKAFGRGMIELLTPENRKVLAFLRRYQEEVILVVANLSRFPQYVELDLSSYAGRQPVELFGGDRVREGLGMELHLDEVSDPDLEDAVHVPRGRSEAETVEHVESPLAIG